MKTYFKLLLCIISILLVQNVFADDYDEYAKKVREEVWAWGRPEFKNYNVPAEFKNESAVILAMHNQLLATGKSRFRIKVTLAMKINKELLYTNTFRKMVKINDKAALDKFSEISYKEEAEASGSMITSKFKTIVGVRIIKPDGIIKEVNVDEAVSVTEGKKDKEDHKKLAISDLQVGDILDYFVQREGHADTENIPPIDFVFANEYPMMSYSVHCEIGNKLTTEYRCVNGAPDFTVSTNDNEDIVLDVQKKDISKMEGMERWTSPYREFPMIRMAVLNNRSKEIWKPKSARKNGLHKDVPSATIFEDAGSQILDNYIGFYMGMKEASKKIADQTKNYKKENPSHTKEELAEFVYDAVQYNLFKEAPYYLTPSSFVNTVNYYLKQNKIDYKAGMVTSKYSARKNEVVNMDDITYLTVVNGNKQIFTFDPIFTIAGEVDYSFEGETAMLVANTKDKTKTEFAIPVSDESKHLGATTMNVNFSPDDMLLLNIDRTTRNRGSLKSTYQRRFFTLERYEEDMRKRLGIKQSQLEEMQKKKSDRKYIDDYKDLNEKMRKNQTDEFKKEIKDYHDDMEAKEVTAQSVIHMGITKAQPDFECNVKYSMEGLVKKAGNNYILDAGKLIGAQLELKDEARKRSVDVYMPTARSYEHDIQVQIPDGYIVENVAALNKKVDNVAGSFTSSATLNGQVLTIKTRKVYKHAFEPLSNWPQLLEMLDGTNEFCAQSVVLKKK